MILLSQHTKTNCLALSVRTQEADAKLTVLYVDFQCNRFCQRQQFMRSRDAVVPPLYVCQTTPTICMSQLPDVEARQYINICRLVHELIIASAKKFPFKQ